jgi:hypothetical protein
MGVLVTPRLGAIGWEEQLPRLLNGKSEQSRAGTELALPCGKKELGRTLTKHPQGMAADAATGVTNVEIISAHIGKRGRDD